MAGQVYVAGQKAAKAGQQVPQDAEIEVRGGEKYVGRGGLKLEGALDHFRIDPTGRVAVDVGASTGGFTDCLLQRGALRVHALDVGHGQLDWSLRTDDRVKVYEGFNARNLKAEDLGEPVDLAVADVSFISLTLILPPLFALLAPPGDMIVLIKPQFELSPDKVGKGGVVRESRYHEEAVARIHDFVAQYGKCWHGVITSPIKGREGNIEFLAHLSL